MILSEWAARWGVPPAALADLRQRVLGLDGGVPSGNSKPGSEAAVQTDARLFASRQGYRLWRNNVGAGYSEDGSFMRWGLANDSKQVNAVVKSGDLIGCRPRIISHGDVGKIIGQFVSLEVKHSGWKYRGDPREQAQLNWANLILSLGGDARFITSGDQA